MEITTSDTGSASVTLNQAETELWESDTEEGRELRSEIRGRMSERVEVYSFDGITLDAW